MIGKNNLFYLPVVITLVITSLIFILLWIDANYSSLIQNFNFIYKGTVEDSKSILKIIVTATVTMTTLVISITMVVLSLFASQLGPRLINSFMGDRKTQVYIGFFFGSISYCLTLLMYIHSQGESIHSLQLSMSSVYIITLLNLFVLLAYVNHIVKSGISDNIVNKVNQSFRNDINEWIKNNDPSSDKSDQSTFTPNTQHPIVIEETGYLQSISYEALVSFLKRNDDFVRIHFTAGDYVVAGDIIMETGKKYDSENIKELLNYITIGNSRTATQDIRYSIRHLSEMGLRALSPGINDHYTANNVINNLGGSISFLIQSNMHQNLYRDENDVGRVQAKEVTINQILSEAFSRIYYNSKDKPLVLNLLKQRLDHIKKSSKTRECRQEIEKYIYDLYS